MKLDKEQQDKLVSKLIEVWESKVCEICNKKKWVIDDTLFELREFHGGRTVLGSGAIKPLITIACDYCGNTKMMNAIQLGLVDQNKPEEEKKEGGDNE